MRITTTARHFDLRDDLREHIEQKLNKLRRYFDHLIDAHVSLAVEKYRHIAEVTLHANGADMRGEGEADDMYTSIDRAVEKLERQIRRHKGRLTSHKDRRDRFDRVTQVAVRHAILRSKEAEEGGRKHEIVETEEVPAALMSTDEAAASLEKGERDFVVFLNQESERISVLYRRKDGSLGLIETKG